MIEGKYLKKEKPKVELPIATNEVRVTAQGRRKAYVDYALRLLDQPGAETIAIKGMGRATTLTLEVVEAVKRRHSGLHQITQVDSVNVTDDYEPLEEGLKPVSISKRLGSLCVTLYKKAPPDTSAPGYQPPTPAKESASGAETKTSTTAKASEGQKGPQEQKSLIENADQQKQDREQKIETHDLKEEKNEPEPKEPKSGTEQTVATKSGDSTQEPKPAQGQRKNRRRKPSSRGRGGGRPPAGREALRTPVPGEP